MIEYVIVPLIGFLIAFFGVFFDAKTQQRSFRTIILVVLLILTAFYSGWSAWDTNNKSESAKNQAIKDKNILQETLVNITKNLTNVRSGVSSIAEYFGIPKNNRSKEVFANSMQADEALTNLSTLNTFQLNKNVTVQYFPKQIDRDLVESALIKALSKSGFLIKTGVGNPTLQESSTNSIWYGANVSDESVKIVALTLVRAGIEIRGIQPLSQPNKRHKINLIQIGSWIQAKDKQPISVEEIEFMQIER